MSQLVMERTRTQPPPPRRMPLWRQRNFTLLWTGQTISLTGSAVTTVGLPLAAITMLGASALQVGLLTAATYGAFILVALPAGVVADRFPKRRIMIWCDSVRLVIIGSVPVAAALHRLTLGQLYAVALAAGVCAVFFDVSEQSYVPSVTCLLLVKGDEPRPERRPAGARQLRRDIPQGLAFIARHPVLRKITACAAAGNLFIAMEIALNLLFLIRVLHMRPAVAGLATSLGSLGGIAGGMLAAWLARRIGSARIIWFSLLVLDAPSLVLPLAAPGWRIALFIFGYGVSMFACSVFGASQLAYRQSVCPPDLRGRMNAASRWITWGVLPIGGLLGGLAGSAIGIRPSIWIAYAGSWAAGFLVYFSPLRRVRNVSDLQAP